MSTPPSHTRFCVYFCKVTNGTLVWLKVGETNNLARRLEELRGHFKLPFVFEMKGMYWCESKKVAQEWERRCKHVVAEFRDENMHIHAVNGKRRTEYFFDDDDKSSERLDAFMRKHDMRCNPEDCHICTGCDENLYLHEPLDEPYFTCDHCTIHDVDEPEYPVRIHPHCIELYKERYPDLPVDDPEDINWMCHHCYQGVLNDSVHTAGATIATD